MFRFVALGLLAAVVVSARVVSEPPLTGWVKAGQMCEHQEVTVRVKLAAQNLDKLAATALAVSDPLSPRYGQFLSNAEVNALTAPKAEHVAAVEAWLATAAVSVKMDKAQGVAVVTGPAAEVEALFGTQLHHVVNVHTGQKAVRAGDYELPATVEDAVAAVFGLHGLPLPVQERLPVGSAPVIGPKDLESAYKVSGVTPSGTLKNRQAVAEFQGQLMNQTDLATFFKIEVPSAPADDAKVYAFHGTTQDGQGIEAQLDIQYIMGVAPGIKTEFFEQLNSDFCSDLQTWTTLLLSTDDIPLVHSISYGWQGNLTQIGCQTSEVTVVDTDFQKLAAKGISIIFASGDSGSGYAPPQPPQPPRCDPTNPGKANTVYQGTTLRTFQIPNQEGAYECCSIAHEIGATQKYAGWTFVPGQSDSAAVKMEQRRGMAPPNPANVGICTIFSVIKSTGAKTGATSGPYVAPPPSPPSAAAPLWPSWPASSSWVTAVGATRFHDDKVGASEDAVNQEDYFGSGGGFSSMFPQGSWQATAVSHYLSTVDPSTLPPEDKASWPKNGRATPDVAALGTGFNVINDGQPLPGGVGGTSASAPTFAAIVSLLNEARIAAGKKGLGFLNPFVYQNPTAFNDILLGSDKIGRGGPLLPYGFNCSAGWDPVTGLGTPNFPELLKAAMALP